MDSTPTSGEWRPDPWTQAQLRWHDGADWTHHVHGQAAATPEPAPAPAADAVPEAQDDPATPARQGRGSLAGLPELDSRLALIAVAVVAGIACLAFVLLQGAGATAPAATDTGAKESLTVPDSAGTTGAPTEAPTEVPGTPPASPGADAGGGEPSMLEQQRAHGSGSDAKVNVKQVVNAVEACSVMSPDGSYAGCDTAEAIAAVDPTAGEIIAACGSPEGACLKVDPDGTGYRAASTTADGVEFVELSGPDGTRTKTCAPIGAVCETGSW